MVGGIVQDDGNFYENDKRYIVWGANYWEAMNLGAQKTGNRNRLVRDLDKMKSMNINNLRIIAASEGPADSQKPVNVLMPEPGIYNDDMFKGLDYTLYQMKKRGMKAVMVLNNFWQWSGGFAQYVSWVKNTTIPIPPGYPENDSRVKNTWNDFVNYAAQFYTCDEYIDMWKKHIKTVINRKNVYTGKRYKDDDTIFSWEFANEPRQNNDGSLPMTDEFIEDISGYIKSLDKNHMVTLGSEAHPSIGKDVFLRENNHKNLDYSTTHIWVQNWNQYDPKNVTNSRMGSQNKPIIFEEYGMARDGWDGQDEYDPSTPATNRLKYFKAILNEVYKLTDKQIFQGQNFWAYSGEGCPASGDSRDLYLGDPAHEHPGWYGIYDKDTDMINFLKKMGKKFLKLN
ncbi:glycoside hydrolase [Neocallimastix lanati (nom. inval.)]|uniref:mannan endo-1,4-beta-mannosidase n=1 Tax=Neocallimastix californiae TaxID=1754190 RepID=A0A1Y2AAS3_9FUNG|nr:glycoside hydrolase [Neocallimastix sp. JGI-2020a]ORY19649.1 glycoside hydrolase [Neocallimastix californiae]|eukprot:ORY19649.1 glycoside hydrolase [Neocallimastix californiae]